MSPYLAIFDNSTHGDAPYERGRVPHVSVGWGVKTELKLKNRKATPSCLQLLGLAAASRPICRQIWIAIFLIATCARFCWASSCFDAENQLLKTSDDSTQGALVYVWSPRMVLSAQHAAQVQQQAAAAGLRWFAVHDLGLPEAEKAAALSRLAYAHPTSAQALQASQPLCDAQLMARDALRHFPTAFVWRDAVFSTASHSATPAPGHRLPLDAGWAGHPIVGAMPPQFWAVALRERLQP